MDAIIDKIVKIRSELSEVFIGLKDGSLKPSKAAELNKAAGKKINSLKAELKAQKKAGSTN